MTEYNSIAQDEPGMHKFNKEELLDILDRIINFVHGCDNKASVFLSIIGVAIAILFTSDGMDNLIAIVKLSVDSASCMDIIYLCVLFIALLALLCGLFFLVLVLFARTDSSVYKQEGLNIDSVIFFGTISKNKNYSSYKEKLLSISDTDYENDIASQIYINGVICKKKYDYYKRGLILAIAGLASFIIIWALGNLIY